MHAPTLVTRTKNLVLNKFNSTFPVRLASQTLDRTLASEAILCVSGEQHQSPKTVSWLSLALLGPLFLGLALLSACSGSDAKPPVVTFTDATPPTPDAAPAPDAFVCTTTSCGDSCVDTSNDPLNCGGCGITCASAGQICAGSLPCDCPAPFVPASIGGGGFDQIQPQGAVYVAIAANLGTTVDAVAVAYDLSLTLGTAYPLTVSTSGTLTSPAVGAGYDIDISTFSPHTAYAATAGTITFTSICAGGASGTISGVVFSEAGNLMAPTLVADGCSMMYDSLAFDIGTCPPQD